MRGLRLSQRRIARAFVAAAAVLVATSPALGAEPAATPPPPEAIGHRPDHLVAAPGAVDKAVYCVCQSHPPGASRDRCMDERRADVTETVADLLWLAQVHDMPRWAWPWLVAQGCRESRLLNDPAGHNDRGTSGGMFQLKKRFWGRWYRARYDMELDVYDHLQSADLVLRRVKHGMRKAVPEACGPMRLDRRFAMAAYRFGRGPLAEGTQRREPVCRPAPGGGQTCQEPRPVQRCSGDPVAVRWARNWYAACPDCWTLVDAREATLASAEGLEADPSALLPSWARF